MSAWKTSTLGEVVNIAGGGTPTRSNPDFYGGTIPWVTPKDMKSWEINGAQITLTQSGVDNSATRVVPKNSILIVVRSGVLKHTIPVGLNRVPVAINQDMKALQCRDGIDADYLARFIKARSPVILQWVRATTADNFPIDKLKKLPVPLPPLAEQRRIAEVLDRAEALRAKRRAALAQLDTLTQSLFLDLFGDPRKKGSTGNTPTKPRLLGDLTRIRTGKLDANAADEDGTHPFFTCAVEPLRINTPAFDCKAVLVAGNGDLNVKYFEGKFNAYQRTYVIESLDESVLVPKFLYAFLDIYVSELRKQAIGGVIKYIKLPYLTDAVVQLPSEEWQREFARRVSAVEKLKAAQRASLAELDALFATLQHRAFRGEL